MAQLLSFEQWMDAVNRVLVRKCGLGVEDIPDFCYRDYYDDGVSAFETASEALDAARDY